MTENDSDKPFVRAIARGMDVIISLGDCPTGLSLSEVAQRVGLDRATSRRILLTLVSLGYVQQNKKQFLLAPKVLRLGFAFLSSTPVWQTAGPYLEQAATTVGGSCSICVLDGDELVYVARANGIRRNLAQVVEVGTRFPLHATSAGKVLLAGLSAAELDGFLSRTALVAFTCRTITDPDALRTEVDRVRMRGWSFSDQEQEDGVRSMALPCRDREGKIVAAINVAVQAARLVDDDLEDQAARLLQELRRVREILEPVIWTYAAPLSFGAR